VRRVLQHDAVEKSSFGGGLKSAGMLFQVLLLVSFGVVTVFLVLLLIRLGVVTLSPVSSTLPAAE